VQGQLAHDAHARQRVLPQHAGRGQNGQRDGQIARRARFRQVRRRQVDDHPSGGKREARVADGGAHPVAALPDAGVRQSHYVEHGQAPADVRLHPDQVPLNAVHGAARRLREQKKTPPAQGTAVGVLVAENRLALEFAARAETPASRRPPPTRRPKTRPLPRARPRALPARPASLRPRRSGWPRPPAAARPCTPVRSAPAGGACGNPPPPATAPRPRGELSPRRKQWWRRPARPSRFRPAARARCGREFDIPGPPDAGPRPVPRPYPAERDFSAPRSRWSSPSPGPTRSMPTSSSLASWRRSWPLTGRPEGFNSTRTTGRSRCSAGTSMTTPTSPVVSSTVVPTGYGATRRSSLLTTSGANFSPAPLRISSSTSCTGTAGRYTRSERIAS